MKKGLLIFLGCIALAHISCKKDEQIDPLGDALIWVETQCNDPWSAEVDRTAADFEVKLGNWLTAKTGVSISQPLRKNVPGSGQGCGECNCKTGNVIYIFPNNARQAKFITMGFRKG